MASFCFQLHSAMNISQHFTNCFSPALCLHVLIMCFYVCLYMCVFMCVCSFLYTLVYVEARRQPWVSFLLRPFTLFYTLTKSLTGSRVLSISLIWLAREPSGTVPALPPRCWGYRKRPSNFLCGCWERSSSPHVCVASTFLTELSPCPLLPSPLWCFLTNKQGPKHLVFCNGSFWKDRTHFFKLSSYLHMYIHTHTHTHMHIRICTHEINKCNRICQGYSLRWLNSSVHS